MSTLNIQFSDERIAFAPREEVTGTVSWSDNEPRQRMELRLFWFTRGKGTEDAGVVDTVVYEQPLPGETRSFQFLLPAGPYSFSGKLISLAWALELIAYPSKQVVRREIEVGPHRREVRLESVQEARVAPAWLSIKTR